MASDNRDILGDDPYGPSLYKTVTDSTATTPAALGKVLFFNGSVWAQNASAARATGMRPGMYGVVTTAALVQGGQCVIQCLGYCAQASVIGDGTHAITAGSILTTDGSGNLTFLSTTVVGAEVAMALAAQVATSSAVLNPVWLQSMS